MPAVKKAIKATFKSIFNYFLISHDIPLTIHILNDIPLTIHIVTISYTYFGKFLNYIRKYYLEKILFYIFF